MTPKNMKSKAASKPFVLTDKNFKHEVLESAIPVVVDFWASWCPPCKMVDPILQKLAERTAGIVKVGKINVDQNPIISANCNIQGVPTFIIFKSGSELVRRVGAQSEQQLLAMLREVGVGEIT